MSTENEHCSTVDYTSSNTPLIVYFGEIPKVHNTNTSGDLIGQVAFHTKCNMLISDTWANLATAMSMGPELLIFHQRSILHESVSIAEFVNMIVTLSRYMLPPSKKMRIAVCIGKDCNMAFIKELQTTEIIGIVPCNADFGNAAMSDGIAHLLSNAVYWPKTLINDISNTKEVVARPIFHLTSRQRQVLTLVCNRGLSNKKIASLLKISESTVKIHVSAILKEYGVRNRTQLALAANAALKA